MLLNYSDGQWPPLKWKDKSDNEYKKLVSDFVLDEEWIETAWEDLSDEELEQWLDDAEHTQFPDGRRLNP